MASNRFPDIADDTRFDLIIDGAMRPGSDGAEFACHDPFEDRAWGRVAIASEADVDEAVQSARRAFATWSRMLPAARGKILRAFAALIETHNEELARLQVHENGKTIGEMRSATASVAGDAIFFATLGELPLGHTFDANIPGHQLWTRREPIGVVAAITPWNNPLGLLGWKLFPALAAGNCVIVKPSEVTPASTLRLAQLGLQAGLPPGVLNVVTGFGATGAALANHPDVDKIAFTGSTATGKVIARAGIERMARVTLELGGKSPNIVFADADLDKAVPGLLKGITAGTGQACNAGSRLLIEDSIYEEVRGRLAEMAPTLRIGDPLDPTVDLGPIASRPQFEKVLGYIDLAKEEGHTLLTGGGRPEGAEYERGFFVAPTLYDGVANTSRLAREEIFGPVGAMMRFTDEEEAVAIANDSAFGLVAGLWSRDVGRVHRVINKLRAGTIWANTWRVVNHQAGFGGFKQSGLGRELGVNALEAYTEAKSVWLGN